MNFADWMVLAAAFLPYLTVAFAKWTGGVDNHAPRRDMERLTGWRQRADWAHRNHFEAFPAFAAAVIIAELAHAAQSRIDFLAGAFIVMRILYTAMYLADLATLRSLAWALAFAAVIGLFVAGA
jgi:uncharacterized MAPEG superfamily protein